MYVQYLCVSATVLSSLTHRRNSWSSEHNVGEHCSELDSTEHLCAHLLLGVTLNALQLTVCQLNECVRMRVHKSHDVYIRIRLLVFCV